MEDDFFLKKMKGVTPFKKDPTVIKNKKVNKKNLTTTTKPEIKKTTKRAPYINKKNTEDLNLSFGEINKDLKKGKVKIDRRIDLHGYSLIDAHLKLRNEVEKNYNNNKRCLLVITGKGAHKKNLDNEEPPKLFYGKIKNSIISWVNQGDLKKYILTYQDAGIEHGGDGAIFIYLRKKRF